MINSTDSFATTQSNSNCLNIPSRLVAWLRGKLVSISKAVKRIFSGESLPDVTPIAERMFSKVKAQEPFFNTPAPRGTTSSREMELYNPANRPLPEIEGVELKKLSWELLPILGGMKELFEVIMNANSIELCKGQVRAVAIENLANQSNFNDDIFKNLAKQLKVSQHIMDKLLEMNADEKLKWLDSINREQIQISSACGLRARRSLDDYNNYLFPLICNFIGNLSEKYPIYSTELASEKVIRVFQKGVVNLDRVLNIFVEEPVGDQIARDASLQTKFSDIRNKLKNIAQSLQIS